MPGAYRWRSALGTGAQLEGHYFGGGKRYSPLPYDVGDVEAAATGL
jgi:hypothetical protein